MGAHYQFAKTAKQVAIMNEILAAVDRGNFITLEELRDRIPHKPKKQAVLCSLRFLEKHGFVTKKYNGPRSMNIQPTPLAYQVFREQRSGSLTGAP